MEKVVGVISEGLEGPAVEHGSIVKYLYRKMHKKNVDIDVETNRKKNSGDECYLIDKKAW